VGHSITLALAVTGVVTLPSSLIRVFDSHHHLINRQSRTSWSAIGRRRCGCGRYRPIFAVLFGGFVHGAGFRELPQEHVRRPHLALPLLGFNVGIELGDFVLGWAFLVLWGVDPDAVVPLRAADPVAFAAPPSAWLRVSALSRRCGELGGAGQVRSLRRGESGDGYADLAWAFACETSPIALHTA